MSETPVPKPKRQPKASSSAAASSQNEASPKPDSTVKVKQEPVEVTEPSKGPKVLDAENFTHGGIRKVKFEPKAPTRRLKKLSTLKSEQAERNSTELPSELLKLVKQSQEDAMNRGARRTDIRAPTRVAFGCGTSVAGRAAISSHKVGSGSGGSGGGGGAGGGGGDRKSSSKSAQGVAVDSAMFSDEKYDKSRTQSWDLSKYYPVTLPLQKPGTTVAEDDDARELEECTIPSADELKLMQESDEDRLLFLQFPSFLPFSKVGQSTPGKTSESSSSKKGLNSTSSTKVDHGGSATWMENIPAGQMGKLLVYSSGKVKLRLGDTFFEAIAGSECVFARELVGINPTTQHCCFLGDVSEKIVFVPCLDEFLTNGSKECQTSV